MTAALGIAVLLGLVACTAANCDAQADIVIWGGTVCGVTASIAAAEQNRSGTISILSSLGAHTQQLRLS